MMVHQSLDLLQQARVLVVGDVMLDQYWKGQASRISPEAPVPVVQVKENDLRLGGAANVALNVCALGAKATLIGIVGPDQDAQEIEKLAKAHGIVPRLAVSKSESTIKKLRILSHHQQLLRMDFETQFSSKEARLELNQLFEDSLDDHDVVVFSDYAKGTLHNVKEMIALARSKNKIVLVDPKGDDFTKYSGATFLTPNLNEFETVAGKISDLADLSVKAKMLIEQNQFEGLIVTMGAKGMALVHKTLPDFTMRSQAKEVYDVTGAGDTVISILAMSLAVGYTPSLAIELANLGGGIVVGKVGTASVSFNELYHAFHGTADEIINEEHAIRLVRQLQAEGQKVVMTNGCFDILHAGHVRYLREAKKYGDVLVVGVNSDASIQALKGPTRPINSLSERMEVLAALEAVDIVVPFEDVSVLRLIEAIKPDVLVKGGDYTPDSVVGAAEVMSYGGEVKVLSLVTGCSTTNIVNKIQASHLLEATQPQRKSKVV